MKWFGLFMAFYMLMLSAMPCSDDTDCESDINNAGTELTQQDKQHTEHEENCSPFCICTCCATSAIHVPVVLKHKRYFQHRIEIGYLSEHLYNADPASIWQPPRLTIAS
jgi:hypothetical protein